MFCKRSLLWAVLTLVPVCGCSRAPDPFEPIKPGQIRVLTSFPPIFCFAANVAGEHGKVLCLLTSTGPHDYQATPLDSIKDAKADVLFINGLGIDEFVAKPVADARKKSILVEVGEAIPDDKLIHLEEADRKHVHADGTECEHGEHDPHVWLGPHLAQEMVKSIAKKLGELKPEHASAFAANAAAYSKQLQELQSYGQEKFNAKKNRRVIVTHDFLRYFAQAYPIEIVGSIQPRPGLEADAGQMAKLVKLCKEKDVQVIVVEPQYSKGAAESLQRHLRGQGIDVRLAEVDPMETAAAGDDGNPDPELYVRRMRANIDNLVGALP
jgi:ABC-type Zn uptake system ZnuABC Zn-binding protein ZnuA